MDRVLSVSITFKNTFENYALCKGRNSKNDFSCITDRDNNKPQMFFMATDDLHITQRVDISTSAHTCLAHKKTSTAFNTTRHNRVAMFICFYQVLKEKQVAKNHKYYFCHIAWTLSSTNHLCLKIMIVIITKNVALHVESLADRKKIFFY